MIGRRADAPVGVDTDEAQSRRQTQSMNGEDCARKDCGRFARDARQSKRTRRPSSAPPAAPLFTLNAFFCPFSVDLFLRLTPRGGCAFPLIPRKMRRAIPVFAGEMRPFFPIFQINFPAFQKNVRFLLQKERICYKISVTV